MRNLKGMPTDLVAATTRAARTLHNVGWRVRDISDALDLSEEVVRELIRIRIV